MSIQDELQKGISDGIICIEADDDVVSNLSLHYYCDDASVVLEVYEYYVLDLYECSLIFDHLNMRGNEESNRLLASILLHCPEEAASNFIKEYKEQIA